MIGAQAVERTRPRTCFDPPRAEQTLEVHDLGRLALRTSYPEVARKLLELGARVRAIAPETMPTMRVDVTGVGRPVFEV